MLEMSIFKWCYQRSHPPNWRRRLERAAIKS